MWDVIGTSYSTSMPAKPSCLTIEQDSNSKVLNSGKRRLASYNTMDKESFSHPSFDAFIEISPRLEAKSIFRGNYNDEQSPMLYSKPLGRHAKALECFIETSKLPNKLESTGKHTKGQQMFHHMRPLATASSHPSYNYCHLCYLTSSWASTPTSLAHNVPLDIFYLTRIHSISLLATTRTDPGLRVQIILNNREQPQH